MLLGVLLLFKYPVAAVQLLLLLLLAWGAVHYGRFWWWARNWKAALRQAEREIPKASELAAVYKRVRERQDFLVRKWPELCQMNGLTAAKRIPLLYDVAPTVDEDFTARIPRTGFDPDDIKAKAPKIAKGLGCSGGIVVRETATGQADIAFNWTNPIRRELALRDLPMPVNGGIAFGVTETGEPAELRLDASKVFVGVQGSGKSVGAEAALASLVTRGEYVRLRVSNPKPPEMKMFQEFEKRSMGRLEVRAYAESAADNLQMIKDAAHAMRVRSGVMKGRKLTKTSAENPLDILWLDEMMMLPKEVFKDGPYGPLGQILVAGRASLNVVWGCTQIFYASEFASMKGLFDERVLYRVKTSVQNDMVIEDATKRGVAAHRIHPILERGVGYIEDKHGQITKFRSAKVEDHELARTIRGLPIEGMATEAPKRESAATEQAVYFIAAEGTDIVKIGIAAKPTERLKELQTASPHKLSILATMPGGKPRERQLHRQFAATRMTGEWFRRTPELDALIADAALGNVDPMVSAMQHARNAREWVTRNSRQLVPARKPRGVEPTNDELAGYQPEHVHGTDYDGLVSAAVWGE